jgi:hypothetical protein
MLYQMEVVWNREFDFIPFGRQSSSVEDVIAAARQLENSGDGARVKLRATVGAMTPRQVLLDNYQMTVISF